MNYTNYTETLRNNLCYALTVQKENKARIESLNRAIENIELVPHTVRSDSAYIILNELSDTIWFLKQLNSVYEKEVSRLITILLEKTQTEI